MSLGIIHIDETIVIEVLVKDNSTGEISDISPQIYLFIMKPDRTVEGPYAFESDETGKYYYEYIPAVKGIYWAHVRDPLNDLIEEMRFVVKEGKVMI